MGCCRLSSIVIVVFNIVILVTSLFLLVPSAFSLTHSHGKTLQSDCLNFVRIPLFSFGFFLFIVSILGFIGSCCRVSSFLWIYSAFVFLLMIALFCFTVFALLVTNQGMGHAVSGVGFKEHRLGDYSKWLQNHVVSGENWEMVRSCLADTEICGELSKEIPDIKDMSPFQSGCCKPPMYCGFTPINATFWQVPTTGPVAPDSDCTTWSNDQKTLCYDCRSCKAGTLQSLKTSWRLLIETNASILVFLIIAYTAACCAYRSNRNERYKGYKGYPA